MWLTLAIAVITYLMSPKGTDKEKRQALTNAALAGGATYLATEYTDWGKDLSNQFDGLIGVGGTKETTETVGAGTSSVSTGKAPSTSTWGSIGSWLTGGVAVGAGASLLGGSIPPWLVWGGIALAAYFILKD